MLHLGMIKFWGEGFVVEGAIIVLLLSVLFFFFSPKIFDRESGPEGVSVSIREAPYA